ARASMLLLEDRLNAPVPAPSPATTATLARLASASLLETLMANAPATETAPPPPEPSPVLADWPTASAPPDFWLARPAALLACWSAVFLPLAASSVVSAPAALALACARLEPSAWALKPTAPPAVTSRWVVAVALSSTKARARETPTAALAPRASL